MCKLNLQSRLTGSFLRQGQQCFLTLRIKSVKSSSARCAICLYNRVSIDKLQHLLTENSLNSDERHCFHSN